MNETFETASDRKVRWAESYPFDIPDRSYFYGSDDNAMNTAMFKDRIPVLAYGSNASAQQIRRKFGNNAVTIPLTQALVEDLAVFYSAHFATYGSIPATLKSCQNARSLLFISWLTKEQLEIMNQSEGLGERYKLAETKARLTDEEFAGRYVTCFYYQGTYPAIAHRGKPVRMAEIAVTNCVYPALTQPAILGLVHRALNTHQCYRAFLKQIIADDCFRKAMSNKLALEMSAGKVMQ